jgi:hypothetical protein
MESAALLRSTERRYPFLETAVHMPSEGSPVPLNAHAHVCWCIRGNFRERLKHRDVEGLVLSLIAAARSDEETPVASLNHDLLCQPGLPYTQLSHEREKLPCPPGDLIEDRPDAAQLLLACHHRAGWHSTQEVASGPRIGTVSLHHCRHFGTASCRLQDRPVTRGELECLA